MKNFFFLTLLLAFTPEIHSQIGGVNTFDFINLQTSPRIIALGGYITSVSDGDINNGIYNPALINSEMSNKLVFNYTNYYSDIMYGDVGYCFNMANQDIISSIKFIDYGQFVETNELGQEIGFFNASEYVFSLGTSKIISDSLLYFGINTKLAYSSFYELSSLGALLDFSCKYHLSNHNLSLSLLVKNLGYQFLSYYPGNRESMPFEIAFGLSSRLAYVPLRWHLTLQHIETFDLGFENTNNLSSDINSDNLGYNILRHVVFGAELLLHKNISLLFGYNNRRRSEMIIEDRKSLVGFSCGFSFKVNRFNFNYSRTSNHFSSPINSFGVVTNLKTID